MMSRKDRRRMVAILVAAYSSWNPPVESMDLFESILAPLEVEDVESAIMERIHSRERFAPTVGEIYTRAKELEHDRRERLTYARRKYRQGEVRYTGRGQRMEADEKGVLRPTAEPRPAQALPTSGNIADLVGRIARKSQSAEVRLLTSALKKGKK